MNYYLCVNTNNYKIESFIIVDYDRAIYFSGNQKIKDKFEVLYFDSKHEYKIKILDMDLLDRLLNLNFIEDLNNRDIRGVFNKYGLQEYLI
jgi:hypothetical protein